MAETIRCPQCGSAELYRDGLRFLADGSTTQRWLCRNCALRFSEKPIHSKITTNSYIISQICAEKAKNLALTQGKSTCAGEAKHPTVLEIKATPHVEALLQQLRNDGRTIGTVENYRKSLARLLREGADLFDPENTKQVLANSKIAQNNKKNVAAILNVWYDFIGVKWKRPRYTKQTKFELPPTEKTLDTTIAGVGRKCAAYLQMLKETGARCGEISALTWKNIDFEQRLVNITPEKGSNPRIIKVSRKALDMINNLPKNGERLFANADDMRSSFFMQRRRLAKKLGDPKILEVHFHSFRIWKGTEEWHRAKDLIHVQGVLGHKNIQV